jgi:hypothetical protein
MIGIKMLEGEVKTNVQLCDFATLWLGLLSSGDKPKIAIVLVILKISCISFLLAFIVGKSHTCTFVFTSPSNI